MEMKTTSTRSVSLFGWVFQGFKAMTYLRPLGALSFALLCSLDAHAQGLIWSIDRTSIPGNLPSAGPVPNRVIGFDHVTDPGSETPPSLNPVTGIFSMTISTNDVGRTFFATALNEPGFGGFVAGLTDGANDYLRLQAISTGTWGGGREADVLGRSSLTPDFAGYNITQIGFRVNSYYDWFYEPENRYLNTMEYSLDFYGAPVPEPSTWTLVTLGTMAVFIMRKRVRK
jgi:hypothetical protein